MTIPCYFSFVVVVVVVVVVVAYLAKVLRTLILCSLRSTPEGGSVHVTLSLRKGNVTTTITTYPSRYLVFIQSVPILCRNGEICTPCLVVNMF